MWISIRHGRLARTCGATAFAVALALFTACDNTDDVFSPGGGGSSNLTVLNSTPADGDATLTVTGTFVVNSGGTGYDELNLSEMVGSVGHDVTVTWDTTTYAIHSVSHGWGSGYAQCVEGTATPCDPAKINIDFANSRVVFTDLPLVGDPFASGATCTLDGTAVW